MSPNDNNPITPSGGTAASPLSPLDFTNPDMLNSTSSLSMSDSLASAQDSLTSAGQAAPMTSSTIGLDELGTDKPSAMMDTPNQPLTPAAPVPGSIGSVTSVPPNPAPAMPDLGSSATMPPVNTAPAAPAAAPVTTSNMPNMGGANDSTNSMSNTASAPAQPYFNPFAANNAASSSVPSSSPAPAPSAPTSSTTIPPALQPQSEKFSDRLAMPAQPKAGGSKVFLIAGWVLALVFLVSTIVMFMFWRDAEDRASKPQVVYPNITDPGEDKPSEEQVSTLTCTQDVGNAEGLGLENTVGYVREMVGTFKDKQLASMTLFDTITFTDPDAAAGAQWYFDERDTNYRTMAETLGIGELALTNNREEAIYHYNIGANADQLIGEVVDVYMLNKNEAGQALTDIDSVKQAYEGIGFVCTVE